MRIAILGAGFTGLTAALRLLQQGHEVTIFEKESEVGGLAIGFSKPEWDWTLEKAYHHWFTNDNSVLDLAKELNHKVIIVRPSTDVFIGGKRFQFDSPLSLLKFPYLPLPDRVRVGLVSLYLKLTDNYKGFEGKKALPWVRKFMGQKSTDLIWEPLFRGKFGDYKENIALTWFWARIKKRTPSLAYPEGGFKSFADRLAEKVTELGGQINLNTTVSQIKSYQQVTLQITNQKLEIRNLKFDRIISTLPSPIFAKIAPQLPADYIKRITSIPHLHAQVMILVLDKPFMDKTYWLNATEKDFPFLVLAEHTNFMDKKHYGNQHIVYIGNYLPSDHPFLKMSKEELLKKFMPYLKKINPKFSILNSELFTAPFAQPVVTTDYPKLIPEFKTPLKNIFLSNLDMVYPWDRGTNYAVEMGEKVARLCTDI